MGSPTRQPEAESGPDVIAGWARTRGEELKVERITAVRAARITKLGIQMSLWLGCMAFSFSARANNAWRTRLQSENGHGLIPCRISQLGLRRLRYRRCVFLRMPELASSNCRENYRCSR